MLSTHQSLGSSIWHRIWWNQLPRIDTICLLRFTFFLPAFTLFLLRLIFVFLIFASPNIQFQRRCAQTTASPVPPSTSLWILRTIVLVRGRGPPLLCLTTTSISRPLLLSRTNRSRALQSQTTRCWNNSRYRLKVHQQAKSKPDLATCTGTTLFLTIIKGISLRLEIR